MSQEAVDRLDKQIAAHAAADELAARQSLDPDRRGELIVSACEAAAVIRRSRRAAGLPPVEPAPWPRSTLDFLGKHAARVRNQSADR